MDGLTALALLIVAMLLLVAEVFVPSGGVLAVSMAGTLVASIYYAYKAWWISSPTSFFVYLTSLLVIVPGTIMLAMYLLPRTRLGRRITQEAPTQAEVTPFQDEAHRLSELIGQEGITVSQLSPGGMVSVKGQRYHAYTESLWIDAQTPIIVDRISGIRMVVRPFLASDVKPQIPPALTNINAAPEPHPPAHDHEHTSPPTPLDLDFPT